MGATRNTDIVPDDENCPKNVCIPNIGMAYSRTPKRYGNNAYANKNIKK